MKLKKPKFWDYKEGNILAILLWPLTLVYVLLSSFSKKRSIKPSNIKTICVGNIYIGGTGKTSLAIKIKNILDRHNIKSCFIKKYYLDQIDEKKILEKYGKIFFNKKRGDSLKEAVSQNYEVAIFDDGLQDPSIDYDIVFVCFNNLNWIGNGFLIPAGPLREKLNKIKKYNNIFLNGNNEKLDDIKLIIKKINPSINIFESRYTPYDFGHLNKKDDYIAFSGIGNHQTFINMLKNEKFKILEDFEFPDHYNYKKLDIEKLHLKAKNYNAQIITTEKDYARLSKNENIKYIKTKLTIKDEDKLLKILIEKDEKN